MTDFEIKKNISLKKKHCLKNIYYRYLQLIVVFLLFYIQNVRSSCEPDLIVYVV